MKVLNLLVKYLAYPLIILVIISGTALHQKKHIKMVDKNLKTIKDAIVKVDFVGWQGLPDSCSPSDILDSFPTDLSEKPTRLLGASFNPAVTVLLNLDGYYRPTVSIRNNTIILFDGMNPKLLDGFTPLRENLKEPDVRLNWFYGTLEIPNGEWVYPKRGITIFLNTSFDKVLHIALYKSTNLADYLSNLRPNLRKRPLPLHSFDKHKK